MSELFRRLQYLFHRRRFDDELANDMDFHREMAQREGGMPLGNTLLLREEAREAWGWTWIDRFGQDVRYAVRVLRKSPGFTLAAVLTLAVGIGVNVAAFGFFDLFALRPLPIRDPDTILRFQRRSPQSYSTDIAYPAVVFYREHSRTLSAVLAQSQAKLALEGQAKQLSARFVTANYFQELGATARLGRMLDQERDDKPGAEPVVVLSHGLWQSRFGSDSSITGKTIRLNGKPATVIGVASSQFSGLSSGMTDIWLPISKQPYFIDGSHILTDFAADGGGVFMWGRLQVGVTPKIAEDELRVLAAELRKQHPEAVWENESLGSEPGGYVINAQGRQSRGNGASSGMHKEFYEVAAIAGALVFLILAVACGNLGSLLLARGVAREREISIRVSVGAGSGRLIRQLFTESLVLALLGSGAGLALGYVALKALMAFSNTPEWLDPTPDWRVALFAIVMGFTAALLFGLTPALQIARQRHRATIMRQFLISGQIAGSCVLLIVAGLLVRALNHALSANPGFEYQQIISIDPGLQSHGYSPESARAYLDALKGRVRDLAGVESVSLADTPPLGRRVSVSDTEVEGRPVSNIYINHVDSQFFQTMRIPLSRGRNLSRGDTLSIVISESLARSVWPEQDPLGKQFPFDGVKYVVVGIAHNARLNALQDPDAVECYLLADTADLPSMVVLVKTSGPPEAVAATVSSIAKAIDPKVFPDVEMMKSAFRRKLADVERSSLAVSVLGALALLLACLGIVGLVAYAVSQRTKEIGIRMALGAKPAHVLAIVLRQFSRPVLVGLAVGIGGAAALSQVLRRQLYGISHLDPVSYAAAIGLFAITVALATLLPARRALRVNPLRALRYD